MKFLLFANTDWYLYNFRLALAVALRERGHELVLVSPPGEYTSRIEQAGFRWAAFDFSRRGMNPLSELNTIARLKRLYAAEKPDLVHHFTIKCVLYGSSAAHQAGNPAVVNAITGLGYMFLGRDPFVRVLRQFVKRYYRQAIKGTRVIFQNPDDLALFLQLRLAAPEQCSLIRGSGVNMERFLPSATEPTNAPLVVLPSRLLWDKGVGEFVSAARSLKASGIKARFALVGDSDPHNPACVPQEQLEQWQKDGDVECWGWREDMGAVLQQAHIVCLPSYREGVPRVLIEAAASGRPLIATDVPGCREVVRDGENGLLVPVRDAAALANAMRTLILDAPRRRRMGANGRALVEANFAEEGVIQETLEVYRSALGKED